jgi:radical SAM protein with 4Fe4S-binding SPASM domain
LKVRDYLNMDAERIEQIKSTATFERKTGTPEENRMESFTAFEQAMIQEMKRRLNNVTSRDRVFPGIVQILLSPKSDDGYPDSASSGQRSSGKPFLDSGNLSKLIQSLLSLDAKFIDFSGGGEPTQHPKFFNIARAFITNGFNLSLLTRTNWVDEQTAVILAEGFAFLRVILNASNDQVYRRISRSSDSGELQTVLRNVERLIREREQRRSSLMIGVETTLTQANMNFVEEIAGLARDLGSDYIQFRAGGIGSDSLLVEQKERVERLVEELRIAIQPFPVYHQIASPNITAGCRAARFQLVIDVSGDLYPCSYFQQHPNVRPFGSIFSQSASNLWGGREHLEAIRALNANECSVSNCRWCFLNHLLPDIKI